MQTLCLQEFLHALKIDVPKTAGREYHEKMACISGQPLLLPQSDEKWLAQEPQ